MLEEMNEEAIINKDYVTCECKDCKTNFSILKDKNIKNCVFCGSENINYIEDSDYKDSFFIPFMIDIDGAISNYKKKVKFNPLIPIKFKRKSTITSISKMYFPTYLVDISFKGRINFLVADQEKTKKNKKKVIETKKYDVSSEVNFDYNNILLNSFSNMDEKEFYNICKYDYSSIKDFDDSILDDSIIIDPNSTKTEVFEKGKEKIFKNSIKMIKNNINHQLKKTQENSTITDFKSDKRVFVPIYYANINYKGKDYKYIMNGVDGKSIIKLPMGIVECIVFGIFVFLIVFLVSYLIAYFL